MQSLASFFQKTFPVGEIRAPLLLERDVPMSRHAKFVFAVATPEATGLIRGSSHA
jgi:hypothetical protein